MSEKNVELSEGTGVVIRECFFEYVMIWSELWVLSSNS